LLSGNSETMAAQFCDMLSKNKNRRLLPQTVATSSIPVHLSRWGTTRKLWMSIQTQYITKSPILLTK
jgi:hypothetical protein